MGDVFIPLRLLFLSTRLSAEEASNHLLLIYFFLYFLFPLMYIINNEYYYVCTLPCFCLHNHVFPASLICLVVPDKQGCQHQRMLHYQFQWGEHFNMKSRVMITSGRVDDRLITSFIASFIPRPSSKGDVFLSLFECVLLCLRRCLQFRLPRMCSQHSLSFLLQVVSIYMLW